MTMTVFLFGDQTGNPLPFLKQLGKGRGEAEQQFCLRASASLRRLVSDLPRLHRQMIPPFDCIDDLVLALEAREDWEPIHPAITSTLLTYAQLRQIYCYLSASSRTDRPVECRVIGLCTGALAASVFACSESIDELDLLSLPTLCLAFRVGLQTALAGTSSLPQGKTLQRWSCAISNATMAVLEAKLDHFHATSGVRSSKLLQITAATPKSITLSGIPSLLEHFVATDPELDPTWLPIYSPYHMRQFHDSLDIDAIFQDIGGIEVLRSVKQKKFTFSGALGMSVSDQTAYDLLARGVKEALLEPLRCDLIVDEFVRMLGDGVPDTIQLAVCQPWTLAKVLSADISARAKTQVQPRALTELTNYQKISPKPQQIDEPLAIVGLAGRFPNSRNHEELWKILEDGLDLHRTIPLDRFDIATHVDPTGKVKNTSWTPYGCFMDDPGLFDPKFFKMSPREAMQTCAMQRLALVTAYEALEMSGFVPNRTPSTSLNRVGTFYGQTSDDYREVNSSQDIGTYYITGGIRAFGPGRINYHFKFNGPSMCIDTACSSSLAAIQVACASIWNGDCDTAIAGGMNILSNPDMFAGLSRGQFLSKTGSCKTFDQAADGYCRGDGVASVVIKRLSEAEADNDHVLGVIRSIATNHSSNAVSITHPHAATQSTLFREVLRRASVGPADVCYVEMHGTGTQAGDGTEMRSMMDVLAPLHTTRGPQNPLYVGSVKANVGHGEAVSGVTALIKTILMLEKNAIPPHCGIKGVMNKTFPDLVLRNVKIAKEVTPLCKKDGKQRTFLVSNFSAAGGNTSLILQDGPERTWHVGGDTRPVQPICMSGHTMSSLRSNVERLDQYLHQNPSTDMASLSYTTTARRMHQTLRFSTAATSIPDLRSSCRKFLESSRDISSTKPGKIAFVFSGQGSHYANMGHQLFEQARQFRSDVLDFDASARQLGFPSFLPLIDGSVELAQLSPTQIQVGTLCIQMALAHLFGSWGISPAVSMGHSLGEYAAAQIAGIITAMEAIYLVGTRARLFEQKCAASTHKMLAVSLPPSQLSGVLQSFRYEIACVNSPADTVISGASQAIDNIADHLSTMKVRSVLLPLPFAYHSAQVDPILEEFATLATGTQFQVPGISYVSSYLGRPFGDRETMDTDYLSGHARCPVQFSAALEGAHKDGVVDEFTTFIEIGPHPVCLNFIKATLQPNVEGFATLRRNEGPWTTASTTLAALHDLGHSVDWSEYHRDFTHCHQALRLPSYAFDNKTYWQKYEGAWTLTRGVQLPQTLPSGILPTQQLLTSSLQYLVSEMMVSERPEFVFESDLAQPHLHAAVTGHLVNGAGLCPSSVYADMALTAADHIRKRLGASIRWHGVNVMDMTVPTPCIVSVERGKETKKLRLHAVVDVSTQSMAVAFSSAVAENWSKSTEHATCTVRYGDSDDWLALLCRSQHLVEGRIAALQQDRSGCVHRIGLSMAYRLFGSLVNYSKHFRGMQEVFLNTAGLEATARVALQAHENTGTFFQNPHWIDSLAHISGFVMNGNELHDPSQSAYISHGWEAMRFCTLLTPGDDYQVYVKMVPITKSMFGGDVWVLKGGQAIGLIENLKFQRLPRLVLNTILPPAKTVSTAAVELAPASTSMPAVARVAESQPRLSKRSPRSSVGEQVLVLLAQELGVRVSELSRSDVLADLGIDSLMSLTVLAQIRERLSLDVSPSLFVDHATIGELLGHLDATYAGNGSRTAPSPSPIADDHRDSGYSTAVEKSDDENDEDVPETAHRETDWVVSMIAEEMGVSVDDLATDTDLADYGMDSLMALTILSKLRESRPDLPATFFIDHRTVGGICAALGQTKVSPLRSARDANKAACSPSAHAASASSIYLQGGGQGLRLFLFPDGSGSSATYQRLPRLPSFSGVYGLQSPFLKEPNAWTCGIAGIVDLYLDEIRRRQSKGPYFMGGWSVGGVMAYEAARKLTQRGEQVAQLFLIDAPCPLVVPPMPRSLISFLDSKGLFADRKLSPDRHRLLMRHFDATVRHLANYKPERLSEPVAQTTHVICAASGACSAEDRRQFDDGSDITKWILDDRPTAGPQGWDTLIPLSKIASFTVQGNHFTMMRDENIGALGQYLTRIEH